MPVGLLELGRLLTQQGYSFTTVTPGTHRLLNQRPGNELASSLRDVLGWSRPFKPDCLPGPVFDLMCSAGACENIRGSSLWRANVRFSTLDGLLFAHSPFPTSQSDAVFFGPDTYRFVRAIRQHAPQATRIVDVGCGTGVGGIALAKLGHSQSPVVLADVNASALRFASLNAELAGVAAAVVQSDLLTDVTGDMDLIIANPPYMRDSDARTYRDGGGDLGEGLGVRIVVEALARLRSAAGGVLLLYTGAPIVLGRDMFFCAVQSLLTAPDVEFWYEELDPDIFSDELKSPNYATVERIAAVLLRVKVTLND